MNAALALSIVGLIIIIAVHIVVIARWSGQIDGYIKANAERMGTMDAEIKRLRDARHAADGTIARHDGAIRELERQSGRSLQ